MSAEIEDLLRGTMGLDAASIGSSAVRRAVEQRLAARGERGPDAYLAVLRADPAERQELFEEVVVPETWFYRDPEAFGLLARLASDQAARHKSGASPWRVLCLPCSTGEEPYSVAMTLSDAGLSPEYFRVDGVDLSARALARARRGFYGRNSFRNRDLGFRDRHFSAEEGGWRLRSDSTRSVTFRQVNLLEIDQAESLNPGYDVVFCRNLLIYFDRPTQERAMATLRQLLAPSGWMFVGPAETALLCDHGFVSSGVPHAFAFRPATALPTPTQTVAPPPVFSDRRPAQPRQPRPSPERPLPFHTVAQPSTKPTAKTAATSKSAGIDEAVRLADQGRLVEAVQTCEKHLRDHGPSATAFYIMGLVRDTTGNPAEAAALYRKALYLDPQHQEALMHLSVLIEAQGDHVGARRLSERARRVETSSRP